MDATTGITVIGTGTAQFAPDAMVVAVGVSVLRPTLGEARAAAAATTDGLLTALRAAAVEDRHIQTEQLTVQPEWDHRGQRPRRTGFRVGSVLRVRIELLDRATAVLDQAVDAGGDEAVLHDVRFVLDPSPDRAATVRELAWADARAKAQHLADLAGAELGDVVEIVELTDQDQPHPRPMMARMAAADAMPAIAEGELALTLSLRARFEIR